MSISKSLTSQELTKLAEFRKRVNKVYPKPDEKLLTWLRANDFNVEKAVQMLRRSIIWRRHNDIDILLEWKSPKVYAPYLFLGYDDEKVPVVLIPFGRVNFRGILELGEIIPVFRFVFQMFETMLAKAQVQSLYQIGIICDLENFRYYQIAHRTVVQGFIEILRMFVANYPELLKFCVFINAPAIFSPFFAMLKPFMHSKTLAKMTIYGSDRAKWLNHIVKLIPKEILPKFWGGTRSGSDEFCSDDWFQEPLPRYFMRLQETSCDAYGQQWNTLKIAAGEILTFDYMFLSSSNDIGKLINWEFSTDNYDVAFALTFLKEAEDQTGTDPIAIPIVNHSRVNSHKKKQSGSIKVKQPGKYVLTFDNSYSRARAKTLHYYIELIDPEDADEISVTSSDNNNQIMTRRANLDSTPNNSIGSLPQDVACDEELEHVFENTQKEFEDEMAAMQKTESRSS